MGDRGLKMVKGFYLKGEKQKGGNMLKNIILILVMFILTETSFAFNYSKYPRIKEKKGRGDLIEIKRKTKDRRYKRDGHQKTITTNFTQADSLNCRLVGRLEYPQWDLDMVTCLTEGNYAYVGGYSEPQGWLIILDISDTSNLRKIGEVRTYLRMIPSLAKSGNYLFAVGDDKLKVIDVENSQNPNVVGSLSFQGDWVYDIAIQGLYAYLGNQSGLRVIDISNPRNLTTIGYLPLSPECRQVSVFGDFAYAVIGWQKLGIIDISNPRSPRWRGEIVLEREIEDVVVRENYAYAVGEGFWVIDISDPQNPVPVAYLDGEIWSTTIKLSGDYAYSVGDGLFIINISNPLNPSLACQFWACYAEEGNALSVQGRTVYNVDGENFYVIDCSDFGPPVVGRCGSWISEGVFVKDTIGYVVTSLEGLRIINLANSTTPFEIGHYDSLYFPHNVYVKDSLAFVADGYGGLRIINVADPENPFEVGFCETTGYVTDVYVKDTFAYILNHTLEIINVSDPTNPYEVAHCTLPGLLFNLYIKDTFAYVASGESGLRIVDISEPESPFEVGFYPSYTYDVFVIDTFAYLSGCVDFRVLNVSDPRNPFEVSHYDRLIFTHSVYVKDTLAYVAVNSRGLYIINVANPLTLFLVGRVGTTALDVWVSGNYAYCGGHGLNVIDISDPTGGIYIASDYEGEEREKNRVYNIAISDSYACLASDSGLQVVDISIPENPRSIGTYRVSNAHTLDMGNTYAYLLASDSLLIIDISNPRNPNRMGVYPGNFSDLKVRENFAYLCEFHPWRGWGLRILNISNPTNPVPRGFCPLGPLYHIAVCSSYAYLDGWGGTAYGLFVVDISDTSNPRHVSFVPFDTGWNGGIAVQGNYAFVATYEGGLLIIDVSNPLNPIKISRYRAPGSASGVSVRGNYAHIAYGDLGLRVIDISNPQNPTLYAYYKSEGCCYENVCAADSFSYVTDQEWSSFTIIKTLGLIGLSEKEVTTPRFSFAVKPNPAKGVVKIYYSLPEKDWVRLKVYNTLGAIVYSERTARGLFTIKGLPAGIYFLSLEVDGYPELNLGEERKLIFVK